MQAVISSELLVKPFFKASIPLVPPGINASYAPAQDSRGKLILVHTPVARQFLNDVAWLFRDQANIIHMDHTVLKTISASRTHVPMSLSITVYYPALWRRDIDGPEKIIIDALFTHFQFLSAPGCKAWNDNRIVEKHTYKREDCFYPRFELEISCIAHPGREAA